MNSRIQQGEKKQGERDNDDHLYCHLNEVQKGNANQQKTGI